MKISNSELNKALKRLLQHSLEGHAVAPRPAIDAAIHRALQRKRMAKARSRKHLERMGSIGLVFLLGLAISLLIGPASQPSTRFLDRIKTIAHHIPTELLAYRKIKQRSTQPSAKLSTSDLVGSPQYTTLPSDHQPKVAASQTRERLPARFLTKASAGRRQLSSLTKGNETDGVNQADRITPRRRQHRVSLNTMPVNRLWYTKRGNKPGAVDQGRSLRAGNYLSEQERPGQTTDSLSTAPIRELASLKPITAPSLAHRLAEPGVLVVAPLISLSPTTSGRRLTGIEKTSGLHWLLSVIPLTTRQRVILLPNSEARVQDVRFSQGLMQSVGYKLNMGVEQHGFQLLLNYTQLQMRSDYAYSTDRYVVEENESQYSIKRIGTPATTTTSLQLVGVAIRKQLDVNNQLLGRFFGTIGLDYSRSLDSAPQHFMFISATVGKTIRLNRGPILYIGSYVDYSFTKLQPIDQLQIRPYQAGLSVALKLRQPTH